MLSTVYLKSWVERASNLQSCKTLLRQFQKRCQVVKVHCYNNITLNMVAFVDILCVVTVCGAITHYKIWRIGVQCCNIAPMKVLLQLVREVDSLRFSKFTTI